MKTAYPTVVCAVLCSEDCVGCSSVLLSSMNETTSAANTSKDTDHKVTSATPSLHKPYTDGDNAAGCGSTQQDDEIGVAVHRGTHLRARAEGILQPPVTATHGCVQFLKQRKREKERERERERERRRRRKRREEVKLKGGEGDKEEEEEVKKGQRKNHRKRLEEKREEEKGRK
jgi:hypothetical protein